MAMAVEKGSLPNVQVGVDLLLVSVPPWDVDSPPANLYGLKKHLEEKGYRIGVFDLNIELYGRGLEHYRRFWKFEYSESWIRKDFLDRYFAEQERIIEILMEEMLDQHPGLVGFSITDQKLDFLQRFVGLVKDKHPHVKVIIGGPTCFDVDIVKRIAPRFEERVNGYVIQEGEITLEEILFRNRRNLELSGIPGFFAPTHPDTFSYREMIKDLSELPFATYEGVDFNKYNTRTIALSWSRGCIGNCTFCNVRRMWKKFRYRSVACILDELKYHVNVNRIEDFVIYDSVINYSVQELGKICDAIIEAGLMVRWSALAVPRRNLTADLFRKLKMAGCYQLEFGIESGSHRVLKGMRKLCSPAVAEENLRMAHEAGIECSIFLIVGFPTETEQDFQETIKFLERNKAHISRVSQVNSLCILQGTPLFENQANYGIHYPKEDGIVNWRAPGNTYQIRKERVSRVIEKMEELGIPFVKSNVGDELAVDDAAEPDGPKACGPVEADSKSESVEITLAICPPWGVDHPPMSLGYLARYLKDHAMDYRIFDFNLELYGKARDSNKYLWEVTNDNIWRTTPIPEMIAELDGIDETTRQLAKTESPVIGFSVVDPNQHITCEVIKRIKKQCPEKVIIVGGPVCATEGERRWLKRQSDGGIDFLVVGEGEVPLIQLLKNAASGSMESEVAIPGVVDCRHSEDPNPTAMGMPLDLSGLSFPDYSGFPSAYDSDQVAAVMWSRGCIGNCSFCKEKSLWDQYRMRTIESILAEIRFYAERGVREFVVYDSLVNGRPKELESLCDAIISENLNIRWSALAVPNRSLTKALLAKMHRAGCFVLIFGVESGSSSVLKLMRKGFLLKDAKETLKKTKAVGIQAAINILVGFPGETQEDFDQTIRFIEENHRYIDRVDAVTPLQLVKGTHLFNHHEAYGIVLPSERGNEYWWTRDGRNTYEIRAERSRAVIDKCRSYGITMGKTFPEADCSGVPAPELTPEVHYQADILFVNPFFNGRPDYDTAAVIEYLKQCHVRAGAIARYDNSEPIEGFLDRLADMDYRFLALKVLDGSIQATVQIVRRIKKDFSRFQIVLWGPGCRTEGQRSGLPSDIVHGMIFQEYEQAFKNLIQKDGHRARAGGFAGIAYAGKAYVPLTPIRDLSRFPYPRYTEFDMKGAGVSAISLRLSRGCPYRCTFCSVYDEEGFFRCRAPEAVVEEIRYHWERNGVSRYVFEDWAMGGNRDVLREFCERAYLEKLPVKWEGRYILSMAEGPEIFRDMAAAGCVRLNFGFVSGSDRELEEMGKPFDLHMLAKSLRSAKSTGIETCVKVMIGFPSRDEAAHKKTLAFMMHHKDILDRVDLVSPCHIQPGCDLESSPETYGIVLPKANHWRDWHDGLANNYSYRRKRAKETVLVLQEMGKLSPGSGEMGEDEAIGRYKNRIVERYGSMADNGAEERKPETQAGKDSGGDRDAVIEGIFSTTEAYAGPEILEIDLTNNCNLSCIGCWCHSPLLGDSRFKGEKKRSHLPTENVISLMGELKELGGAGMVQLAGAGEPFLHPGIWEIIETIKESGLRCSIITNFSMLDDKGIQRLVDLGVDAITASIWAGDPQTYLKTHPGAPTDLFDRIRDRLSRLAQLKPAGGIPKVKLYHVISTENADTMAEMVDLPLQVGADAVEFQMVDVVPGKTDALRPDRSVQDRILEQFEAIRKRPDYTEELVRLDHLEPFEDEVLCRELTEFGRIYPRLPEGFSYLPFHNAVRCPCGVGSIEKHISWRKEPITFVFDPESCEHCAQRTACWERAAAGGRLNVHPVSILGGGSFLRRLGSSGLEIQQYERQIIDRVPCTVGWTYSRITVEGNVLPCCKASDFPLGNIHKDSFRRIWQSRAYSTFRQKAKELPKNDPYFSRIQCYKSCDNLGMNLMTHLRFINYQKNQER